MSNSTSNNSTHELEVGNAVWMCNSPSSGSITTKFGPQNYQVLTKWKIPQERYRSNAKQFFGELGKHNSQVSTFRNWAKRLTRKVAGTTSLKLLSLWERFSFFTVAWCLYRACNLGHLMPLPGGTQSQPVRSLPAICWQGLKAGVPLAKSDYHSE